MSAISFEALRRETLEANLELVRRGLVLYTFGNASGISREDGVVAIKPSGVPYEKLRPEDIVLTDLEGRVLEGSLRPSSDLPTHLALYNAFPTIGGVAHTHSEFATAWAQARRPIPCFGTTHADYFHGPVPVTEPLEPREIDEGYEKNTGLAICRTFADRDPDAIPAALVAGHAPFCWGRTPAEAAHIAVVLEAVARMAYYTGNLSPNMAPIEQRLHDKHYLRKHGSGAYYGQGIRNREQALAPFESAEFLRQPNPSSVVDLVMELEGEVNNGGFHQFFNNSPGDKTSETILALEAIEARVMADIVRRAASRFPGNMPPRDRKQRLAVLWDKFPQTDEFRDLDEEFWAYPEDLAGLIAAYRHRFPDSFPGE